MTVYNAGLDELKNIATADLRWILLKGTGYTFSKDHGLVSDLVPASNEVSASGYAREALTGGVRTVESGSDRITYVADEPNFGSLATGQSVTGIVLYRHVTDDTDSVLVAYYPFAEVDSGAVDPFLVEISNGGLLGSVSEA